MVDINLTDLEGLLHLGLDIDINGLRVEGGSIRIEGIMIIHNLIHIHTSSNTSISGILMALS